ncbi:L-asparaginase [Geosmithia morbida]|uniref:L-asparaginase n=1 Tax=Geosmithia morbida TaxID=1094350 RepID=A0A9P4YSQ3_9HYPO|nr:L-asparaginase [Geosmithia morbida]KAF4122085.1 L-asparaginase [Geosmithia morbida]
MEYSKMAQQEESPCLGPAPDIRIKPRIIIHGGAGNIQRGVFPPEEYAKYRSALIKISPSALDSAVHAVTQLEDNGLFNSGYGAVFTRDGVNELEASVMVSRGHAKRTVGVMGLRHVRNPIVLAQRMLQHGDEDLSGRGGIGGGGGGGLDLDVPSAQGHTQIYGQAAEQLAEKYGLPLVDPSYFFTQRSWDEHVRGLERERERVKDGDDGDDDGSKNGPSGHPGWDADRYVPQGTCGAVALDADGVICVATSTGGLTNKLTGRVGDTPVPGAGFWAEEWIDGDSGSDWTVSVSGPLRGVLADCLPTPFVYTPTPRVTTAATTTRSLGISGTGNGDSFLRAAAARTAVAVARWKGVPGAQAVGGVVGPGGELQRGAGDRWGRTGEGSGGMIGIESVVVRRGGRVVSAESSVVMDYNCAGMFRAWIDEEGRPIMSVWNNEGSDF